MKNKLTTLVVAALCTILACTKESGVVSPTPAPGASHTFSGQHAHSVARLSGPHYSQSISVDTANRMISSYLTGVGYPNADTSMRALSFDADTLRAYLSNPDITTVKFIIAHQASYINSGHYGTNSGMNPAAITLVIAGMDDGDHYVLNNRNGVYDNMSPCPFQCQGDASSLIQ